MTVITRRVRPSSLDTSLIYRGTAMPWDQVVLSFKSSGRIRKLTFEEGDLVKKGQFLGALDEIDYWLQRRLADIQVKTLKPDWERVRRLSDQNVIPGAEKDRMEGRFKAAKTQLLQAESMLSGTHLRAPMSGIVVKKMVTVGDLVSPSRPAGVILDLSRMKIVVVVPEVELGRFARGVPVTVTVEALGLVVPGTVHRISYTADEKTRGFPVTVVISNIEEKGLPRIRAGMLSRVKLQQPPVRGIFLPFPAVMEDLKGRRYVYVSREGHAEKRIVTVGAIVKNLITITAGLAEGDEVVVSGQRYLRPGALLRQGAAVPERKAAAPVKKTGAPEQKTTASVKKTGAPERKAAAPVKKAGAPEQKTTASVKKTGAPEQKAAAPVKKTGAPEQKAAAPEKRVVAPKKKAAAPEKKVALPMKRAALPMKKAGAPTPHRVPAGAAMQP